MNTIIMSKQLNHDITAYNHMLSLVCLNSVDTTPAFIGKEWDIEYKNTIYRRLQS